MKTVKPQFTIACMSLIFISLLSITRSDAKVTLEDAAGIWLLDENGGNVVTDASGNGNDGEIQGATWEEGKIGSALSFNGSSDHVVIPDSDSLDLLGEWSITAWIFVNESEVGYGHILGKRSGAGTNYAFRTSSTGDGWESYFWRGAWQGAWGQGEVQKGVWLYMTSVYDGKNTVTIYENGVPIGSADIGGPPPVDTSEVHIGGWQANTSELLDGLLDEVALFGVALTEDDINRLMDDGIKQTILSVDSVGKLAISWGRIKVR